MPAMPAPSSSATDARSRRAAADRLAWPDVARGLTVLMVVAMHIMYLQIAPMMWSSVGRQVHQPIIDASTVVRMPLFFVISGFLSASALRRSWRSGFSGRIAPRYYLYVVWLAITTLVVWWSAVSRGGALDVWDYFVPQLWLPGGILWYIWALAAYFAVARATRAVPVWLVLLLAAAGSVTSELVDVGAWGGIISGFLPFAAGIRLAPQVRALTERVDPWWGALLAAVTVVLVTLEPVLPFPPVAEIVTSGLCVAAVLILLPRTAGWAGWRPVRHVGRHTLAIFAMHPLFIILCNYVLVEWPELTERIATGWWSLVLPVAELLAIVLAALGLERLLRAIGLRHLFEMPRWRTRRARRAARVS